MTITLENIGTIYTPFTEEKGMPIQAVAAKEVEGYIEVNEEFLPGLQDIEQFSHLTLIYYLHLVTDVALEVTPFLDNQSHGVFATRYPRRPNQLGLSTVRLKRVEGNRLYISEVDMLNETPLLDIKPFVPQFDNRETDQIGWFQGKVGKVDRTKAYEGDQQ
ncbi:tRNA (N6-threonylcarbamoyladenosine(37)-N6)-methyltransferase TrmO [Bacillus sp. REN10]|uniref:tRNA (N6-threonylcarbamoyladenosine(37)-N6)-methyltransferase TrmO n=1 Tax=Bacillus sp. REN10 TaxID=2782541 RepID=UPI00193C8157|nr:tRNA (N6-threonylcarbamoyladenosine(37)-N6)-methyltransferase TrmO [Bacillus sp. REN10]